MNEQMSAKLLARGAALLGPKSALEPLNPELPLMLMKRPKVHLQSSSWSLYVCREKRV